MSKRKHPRPKQFYSNPSTSQSPNKKLNIRETFVMVVLILTFSGLTLGGFVACKDHQDTLEKERIAKVLKEKENQWTQDSYGNWKKGNYTPPFKPRKVDRELDASIEEFKEVFLETFPLFK